MGEFDLSLIREFRKRPALYDRNTAQFKDKAHIAYEWQEVSHKLGYDVSLLKDRMLQLRNRYNLEKRRLDQIREENPGQPIESPWPLYTELHFLSDHIRSRRSYKRLVPFSGNQSQQQKHDNSSANEDGSRAQADNSASESSMDASSADIANGTAAGISYANGIVDVKLEPVDSDNETEVSIKDTTNTLPAMVTINGHFNTSENVSNNMRGFMPPSLRMPAPAYGHTPIRPPIAIRNVDSLRDQTGATSSSNPTPNIATKRTYQQMRNDSQDAHEIPTCSSTAVLQTKKHQKFYSFGEFVASSLRDLPQSKSLQLIEKFTIELVKSLKRDE